jgi:adenosylmethionine-8-amino-7-oxononanoate aminotransferase
VDRTPFLHPFARPTGTDWLTIVRGEGAAVWDDRGRRLVDGFASLWYCNVGHGRTEIADAVAKQLGTLETYSTFDRFTNEPAEELAARLAAVAPMPDARVFFTSSGSEAVDSAIKLVRVAHARAGRPERTVVVSQRGAYHGVTYGGTSAQGLPPNQEGFGPLLPGVAPAGGRGLDAITAAVEQHGDTVAAVLVEPVIGAGGVYPPAPDELAALRALCDAHGAFMVLDEVVCAFGRLGRWWGADRYEVVPDACTFAKGVTSGYLPLGGVVLGRALLDPLEADADWVLRHGHTYSGHATCCVAALANLDVLEHDDLFTGAARIEQRLGAALQSWADSGRLPEVRGVGGMWGFTLPPGLDGGALLSATIERGVIGRALADGNWGFCPPLCIDDDDLDRCVDALDDALASLGH